jgi:hypothetical protein
MNCLRVQYNRLSIQTLPIITYHGQLVSEVGWNLRPTTRNYFAFITAETLLKKPVYRDMKHVHFARPQNRKHLLNKARGNDRNRFPGSE